MIDRSEETTEIAHVAERLARAVDGLVARLPGGGSARLRVASTGGRRLVSTLRLETAAGEPVGETERASVLPEHLDELAVASFIAGVRQAFPTAVAAATARWGSANVGWEDFAPFEWLALLPRLDAAEVSGALVDPEARSAILAPRLVARLAARHGLVVPSAPADVAIVHLVTDFEASDPAAILLGADAIVTQRRRDLVLFVLAFLEEERPDLELAHASGAPGFVFTPEGRDLHAELLQRVSPLLDDLPQPWHGTARTLLRSAALAFVHVPRR